MKLATNTFTQGLANGEAQVGLWVTLSSNVVAEVVAPAGYNWVLLDMDDPVCCCYWLLRQIAPAVRPARGHYRKI